MGKATSHAMTTLMLSRLWCAAMTQFTHHGIIHVPLGYTAPNGLQFGLDEVTVRCGPPICFSRDKLSAEGRFLPNRISS